MKLLRTLLLLVFVASAGLTSASAAEHEEKVVYHINDSAQAWQALNNIRNHLNASPKAKIVVVTHGGGIDFLLDDAKNKTGNPYDIPVQELAGRGVQFRVCHNTLETRKLDQSKVLPEATIVPSGVAEIARLQSQEGYVYLKP